jgi:hypothetical protein
MFNGYFAGGEVDPADGSGWDVDEDNLVPVRSDQHLVLYLLCYFALAWGEDQRAYDVEGHFGLVYHNSII